MARIIWDSHGSKINTDDEMKTGAPIEKFWMVYGLGRGAPTYRHETKESAHTEASRLALANPGTTYIVLKATKGYVADIPQVNQVDLVQQEEPVW